MILIIKINIAVKCRIKKKKATKKNNKNKNNHNNNKNNNKNNRSNENNKNNENKKIKWRAICNKNKPKDGEFKTKVSVFSFHTATVFTTRPELTPIKK